MTAGAATATGVIVVVVVVTAFVGAGGGGADTTCETGSEAQPARRTSAPQKAKTGANGLLVRAEAGTDGRREAVGFMS